MVTSAKTYTHLICWVYSLKATLESLYWLCLELADENTESVNWYNLFITKVYIMNFDILVVYDF
jgi:hypothetical protein